MQIPFIEKLITNDTPILELKNNPNVTIEQKYQILGMKVKYSTKQYIEHMYHQNKKWYYYKREEKNYYPYYLLDELMGSFLAHTLDLSAVSFQIARTDDSIGIVSENFRKKELDYYFLKELSVSFENKNDVANLDILKSFCTDFTNKMELEEQILKLFALDFYMLQQDRGNVNLQFKKNPNTEHFALAPIYDFSMCLDKADFASIHIPNPIVTLTSETIPILFKKYPQFLEYLNRLFSQTMSATWDQICAYYHFNQDCYAYEQAKTHYQVKENNQKILLKKFTDKILKNYH